MAKKPEVTRLTLQEAVAGDEKSPLFALNTFQKVGKPGLEDGGELFLPVKDDGDAVSVKLEKTWLAQELTNQIGRTQILGSRHFRSFVTSGYIEIVTPEYAAYLDTQPGAREERARLHTAANVIDALREETLNRRKQDAEDGVDVAMPDLDGETEASVKFRALVTKWNGMKQVAAINQIKARGKLRKFEAVIIATESVHPKIRDGFAKYLED